MESIELEPIRDLLVKAYDTTMGDGCTPETQQSIEDFEQKYNVKLPTAYRALLLEFGERTELGLSGFFGSIP
ncbi:SMI1/KNR4 family protein [Paenibacillus xylanexedens]|uniref:SMI1/KNR4 family protein n=1 Tax=Paenibacillus xylanexedens TaxID=528191 RepID=UPI003CFE23AA